ncbi:pyridoxamine 5'-phosphate oxidase family protein [Pyruvatibacter mobilis]|uniref:pyridoxamine 5'-phosphate oxidase family protein n=1 Tax=Pyruvatibacter mobilis TaxID=1712261 RepID=UPI003C7DD303
MADGTLRTEEDLRGTYAMPGDPVLAKDIRHIDAHCARFIELSPFCVIGTSRADGFGDVSPRGGAPGFVHVLDKTHLAMPDRPGNNRLDTLGNITANPAVGLLFFLPGVNEMLRVNGTASISTDPELMARFDAEARPPLSVMVFEVKEAYMHCAKAIKRAGLWDPAAQIERADFPSLGQIMRDQLSLDVEAELIDQALDQDARDNLY